MSLPSVPMIPGHPEVQDYLERLKSAASAASATATGTIELATDAEVITGTDAVRAVTPAGLKARLLGSPRLDDPLINDESGLLVLQVAAASSAVNAFELANAATGGAPSLGAVGSDTNINLRLLPKGTGAVATGAGTIGGRSTLPGFSVIGTRTLGGTAYHGFADESTLAGATGIAADALNSYDAIPIIGTGTGTYNHYSGFQARPTVNCTAIGNSYGFYSRPTITSGMAANSWFHFAASAAQGAALALANEVSFYVDGSGNATNKYSFLSDSAGPTMCHVGPGVFGGTGAITDSKSCAILTLTSTAKGLLLSRMTKAQRDAIGTPLAGLAVYQTDNTPGLRVYNGTNWMRYTETAD